MKNKWKITCKLKEGRRKQRETRAENTDWNVCAETEPSVKILYRSILQGPVVLPTEVWTYSSA